MVLHFFSYLNSLFNVEVSLVSTSIFFISAIFLSFSVYSWRVKKAIKQVVLQTEKRLCQNVHDELGALTTIVKLQIQSIDQSMNYKSFNETKQIALQNIDLIIQEIRNITRKRIPYVLLKHGLHNSIRMIGSSAKLKGIKFEFMSDLNENLLTDFAKQSLFYIMQECINNSLKHSNCTRIELGIKAYEDQLVIIYYDNGGNGNNQPVTLGTGFNNILNRVKQLNGRVQYDNTFTTGSFYHIFFDNLSIYITTNQYENYA